MEYSESHASGSCNENVIFREIILTWFSVRKERVNETPGIMPRGLWNTCAKLELGKECKNYTIEIKRDMLIRDQAEEAKFLLHKESFAQKLQLVPSHVGLTRNSITVSQVGRELFQVVHCERMLLFINLGWSSAISCLWELKHHAELH